MLGYTNTNQRQQVCKTNIVSVAVIYAAVTFIGYWILKADADAMTNKIQNMKRVQEAGRK